MEKLVLVCLKNLCLILISLFVMYYQFFIMMVDTSAASPHTETNSLILYYKVFVRIYVIIVCITFVYKLFSSEKDDSTNPRVIIHTLLIIVDIVVSVQLLYDIMLFLSSEPLGVIITLISLGFMIWHIKDCNSVIERSKNGGSGDSYLS